MAITLNRTATLVLVGPERRIRGGREFGPATRSTIWVRPLRLEVSSDPTEAGAIPVGALKLATRYRADLARRTDFGGHWTPPSAEREPWRAFLDPQGDVRDSVALDGVLYAITETSEITTEPRRRYVAIYGEAIRSIREVA